MKTVAVKTDKRRPSKTRTRAGRTKEARIRRSKTAEEEISPLRIIVDASDEFMAQESGINGWHVISGLREYLRANLRALPFEAARVLKRDASLRKYLEECRRFAVMGILIRRKRGRKAALKG